MTLTIILLNIILSVLALGIVGYAAMILLCLIIEFTGWH